MANTYQIFFNGSPAADDFYTELTSLEVEENLDLPGAFQLSIPLNRTDDGDLNYINDSNFQPLVNVAVVVNAEGQTPACIFDGYLLSQHLHLERGTTNATLQAWGQDATWLMNLEEKVREWVDVTDADVANAIFGEYGITPAAGNTADDSPSHTEDGHSLMQRGSDIQFLLNAARRNGKICRVACTDTPGQRIGYFIKPALDGDPAVTLTLNGDNWNVGLLDLEWDVTRPTAVVARQALFNDSDEDGVSADTSDDGLTALADRGLAAFSGKTMTVLLSSPVDDGGELTLRAQSVLRESGWFVKCEGEADLARLGMVLRAGDIVSIEGIGAVNSGNYYVWSVRHMITAGSHKMRFRLVRNAVGTAPGGGGLAGLLGGL